MSWLRPNMTADSVCTKCATTPDPVPQPTQLITETELANLVTRSNGTDTKSASDHSTSIAKAIRNRAERGTINDYPRRYCTMYRTFKQNGDKETMTSGSSVGWKRPQAREMRERMGAYLPRDRLEIECNTTGDWCQVCLDIE